MVEISIREKIVKCLDKITKCILYYKLYRPIEKEKDPFKRLEKRLWLEIRGAFLGGMAADGAWTTYKQYYYDKLPTEEEKKQVQSALLRMLKSNDYDISKRAIIAHVCADLQLKDAFQDVSDLLQQAVKRSDKITLQLAHDALSRGITVYELVNEKFRRGERM